MLTAKSHEFKALQTSCFSAPMNYKTNKNPAYFDLKVD